MRKVLVINSKMYIFPFSFTEKVDCVVKNFDFLFNHKAYMLLNAGSSNCVLGEIKARLYKSLVV